MRSIPVLVTILACLLTWHRPDAATASRNVEVPILMYHVLSEAPPDAPHPDLYVAPRDFRAQLAWLDRQGYTAVTLGDVWGHWRGRGSLPARPIVITIDDGFRDTYTVGLPALRAHGWPGVLNLALSHLDVGWGLTEHRMRALIRTGWEIGAHSLTHADLTTLSAAQLRREVAGSKRLLERRFGIEVDFFCYPSGRFDARVIDEVKAAGYRGATTTRDGLARRDEPFTLRRIRISRGDGVDGLAEALGQPR